MAPVIEGLSQHRVAKGDLTRIFVNGTGFTGATGVQVSDAWCDEHRVDGDTVITVSIPDLEPGAYWVVVHGADGDTSACDGPNQTLEILEPEGEAAAAAPRLTGIAPEEIVLGEANTYWLIGEGLTHVTGARCGSHALEFEGYDETNLKIEVPADLGVQPGGEAKITVWGSSGPDAVLMVPTRGRPDDTPQRPMLDSCEPYQLGPDGGEFTIRGEGFGADARVWLGDIECTDVSVIDGWTVRATAPSLAEHAGSTLVAMVMSHDQQSVSKDATITVSAS